MKEDSEAVLSKDEIHMIYNALNEVCNGIEVPEFEVRMGYPESQYNALLRKIGDLFDNYDSAC